MKKAEIEIGKHYAIKVSGSLRPVRIDSEHHVKGWIGTNRATGHQVRIKTAARARYEVQPEHIGMKRLHWMPCANDAVKRLEIV